MPSEFPASMPGVGGSLAAELANIVVSAVWDLFLNCDGPFTDCLEAFFVDVAGPFALFYCYFFPGPPCPAPSCEESHTDYRALFLLGSQNCIVRLWGLGLRALETECHFWDVAGAPKDAKVQDLCSRADADLTRQLGASGHQMFLDFMSLLAVCGQPLIDPGPAACNGARATLDNVYLTALAAGLITWGVCDKAPAPPPAKTCGCNKNRITFMGRTPPWDVVGGADG
jgi:hypothetical protein